MIVKVEWHDHDRTYSIGIVKFLKMLGYDVNEKTIKKIVKGYIAKHE